MIDIYRPVPDEDTAKKLAEIYEKKGAQVVEIKGDYVAYFKYKTIHVHVDPEVKLNIDIKRFLLKEALDDSYLREYG